MRRCFLMFFSLFWTLTAICQETKLIHKKFHNSKQISENYTVLKSDKLTKHGEYISYFQTIKNKNLNKQIRKGIFQADEYIRLKGTYNNGKKDGEWIEYSKPRELKSKGNYDNNKKVGIWMTSKEKGKVFERFDFDNNTKLSPIIHVNTKYPGSALESGIQGTVIISFQTHKDCSISDIEVVKNLSADCDKAAIETMKEVGVLFKKYEFNCEEKTENIEIKFILN